MSKKVWTFCSVSELGELKVEKRDLFVKNLTKFAGVRCKITVEKLYEKHSDEQRSYYFGVLIPCCQEGIETEWGEVYTVDETHLLLKENCLYDTKTNEKTGEIIKVPKSLSALDLVEMIEYIERCIKLISDFFNIEVPPASKTWREDKLIIQ